MHIPKINRVSKIFLETFQVKKNKKNKKRAKSRAKKLVLDYPFKMIEN